MGSIAPSAHSVQKPSRVKPVKRHGHPVRRACHELVAIHVLLVRGAQHRCESVRQHRKESSHARLPNWSCREATHGRGGRKRTGFRSVHRTGDGQFSSAVCDSCRMPRCRRTIYIAPPAAPLHCRALRTPPPLPAPTRTPTSPRPQPPSPWPPQTPTLRGRRRRWRCRPRGWRGRPG